MVEHIEDLDDLKTAVQSIIVKDYGDFKRKTVLYLNRYKEKHSLNAQQQQLMTELMNKIQYNPNLDIENTRTWTLEQLEKL